MSDTMEYKGYVGSVHSSSEDDVFHGKVENIRDLVTYEGTDITSVKHAFFEAVDDYLSECKKRKKEPDVPFKGTFNVRIGPELHKKAALFAAEHRKKLNSVVSEAIEHYLETAAR
jgi:predicted HicB family RNase H-like nuclease